MFVNIETSEFPKTGIPKSDALNFRDYHNLENSGHQILVFLFKGILKYSKIFFMKQIFSFLVFYLLSVFQEYKSWHGRDVVFENKKSKEFLTFQAGI